VLLPGEAEVARAVGTWRTGTLASVDGYLVLTTQRLVLASEASEGTVAVLTWSLREQYRGRPTFRGRTRWHGTAWSPPSGRRSRRRPSGRGILSRPRSISSPGSPTVC